jgi:hypothetical protein
MRAKTCIQGSNPCRSARPETRRKAGFSLDGPGFERKAIIGTAMGAFPSSCLSKRSRAYHPRMPSDFASVLLLVVTSVITFTAARYLSRNWRRKRREKEENARREGESRQVRRARERSRK